MTKEKDTPETPKPKPSIDTRLDELERKIALLELHVFHFLPDEGPKIPKRLKD